MTLQQKLAASFPNARPLQQGTGCSDHPCHAIAAEGELHWGDYDSSDGSPSFHRQTNRSPQNLRRSSSDRHRKRAAIQRAQVTGIDRTESRLGAADGHKRDSGRHRQLADRCATCFRYRSGKCRAGLWRERCTDLSPSMEIIYCHVRAIMDKYPDPRHGPIDQSWLGSRAEPFLIGKLFIFDDSWLWLRRTFLTVGRLPSAGIRTMLADTVTAGGYTDRRDPDSPTEVRRSPRSRSNFSKPSPTRPSSPSKTCGCSRNSGAQRRIARGPGASDGNGRGARHHQPLADGRAAGPRRHRRERRRVCGIDDVVLRLREGNTMVARAHFGPIPIPPRRDQY